MSKLKIDTRSLTDAMQNNSDFVPTLLSALSGNADALQLASQLQNATVGDHLAVSLDGDAVLPSELRSTVEQERHEQMMATSTLS